MTARAADTAAIEVEEDAVRILVGRVQKRARSATDPGRARATRRPAAGPVKHVDSRVRRLAGDDAIGSSRAEEALLAVVRYLRLADRTAAPVVLFARAGLAHRPEGAAILSRLASDVPDPVRLLSPHRQTELLFEAVRQVLDPDAAELVVALEAGTTELLVASQPGVAESCLLPVGPATIAAGMPDPPTPLEWALEAMRVGESLADARRGLAVRAPGRIFVTGAGGEALAGFEGVRADKAPVNLTVADLDRLSDEVVRSSTRKVARRTGDDPRRIALLAPSALILAAILDRFGMSRCTVLPQGLRDGVVLAATVDPEAWWRDAGGSTSGSFDVVASGG